MFTRFLLSHISALSNKAEIYIELNPVFLFGRSFKKEKISMNSINTLNSDSQSTQEDEIEVEEDFYNVVQIPYAFIDAGFDADTCMVYQLIMRRAHHNKNGFFEKQKTTCSRKWIKETKLKECNKLLSYCNIIKIEERFNSDSWQIPNKITILAPSKWNLDHEHRDAGHFVKATKKVSNKIDSSPHEHQ
jgi:hypothetical protein